MFFYSIHVVYKSKLEFDDYADTLCKNYIFLWSKSKCVKWFIYSAKSNSLEKDILFGIVYIPPRGSAFTNITCFEELQEDLLNFNADNKFYVCLLGDYNAHTGTEDDYVTLDSYICDVTNLDEDTISLIDIIK